MWECVTSSKLGLQLRVLSLAIGSAIMRECTVVLLSLTLSLCSISNFLYMRFTVVTVAGGVGVSVKGAALAPNARKGWQPLMLVNR